MFCPLQRKILRLKKPLGHMDSNKEPWYSKIQTYKSFKIVHKPLNQKIFPCFKKQSSISFTHEDSSFKIETNKTFLMQKDMIKCFPKSKRKSLKENLKIGWAFRRGEPLTQKRLKVLLSGVHKLNPHKIDKGRCNTFFFRVSRWRECQTRSCWDTIDTKDPYKTMTAKKGYLSWQTREKP